MRTDAGGHLFRQSTDQDRQVFRYASHVLGNRIHFSSRFHALSFHLVEQSSVSRIRGIWQACLGGIVRDRNWLPLGRFRHLLVGDCFINIDRCRPSGSELLSLFRVPNQYNAGMDDINADELDFVGTRTEITTSDNTTPSCGWIFLVALVSSFCVSIPSFFVGAFYGYYSNDVSRGDRDVDRVNLIIEAHPEKFGSLSINRGPADKFRVEGTVESQQDLNHLLDKMIRAFGEERTNNVLAVTVDRTTNESASLFP